MKRITELERKYVMEVLESEFRTSKMTNMTTRFESAFAERFGVEFAVSHANGTATMHSALAAAGVGPGDEVIVPPLTMASTALVVLYQCATPVFVDIEPETWTLDPKKVEAAINPKTKAIIPVSVYGLAPDYDPLLTIAKKHKLAVIEDNAECYLGYYKERLVGTFGDMASFSLQGSKHVTAGEGGVVLTNDEGFADRMRAFSIVGYDLVKAKSGKITKDILQSPDFVRHTSLGFKYKMPDLCAAVGLAQIERVDELVEVRQNCAKEFERIIVDCPWLTPQKVPLGSVNSYYTYAMRLHTDEISFSWHDFRRKFIELGGDGFYAAWLLTYNEPMWESGDFRIRQVVHNYGGIESFRRKFKANCPVAEATQPQIIQLKSNYIDQARLATQTELLRRTIEFFL